MNKYLIEKGRNEAEVQVSVENSATDSDECVAVTHSSNGGTKRKKGFSKVWKYFVRSQDKKLAKCVKCGKVYKTSGNTSNLRDHLTRFHPNCEENEENSDVNFYTSSSSRQSSIRAVASYFSRAIEYENDSKRKKDIDYALTRLITLCMTKTSEASFGFQIHAMCCQARKHCVIYY
ncbi:uncharacterized protein LOC118750547 [Rhagoletis pomonella]|uniref:uncharacterized protein LOC118750547 n=1 Tax=Rhagoletis pomonella TaxID=28610 RepID=UPI001782BC5C|nr:uncharacterized protein LOC118750547 [Rhagoletis pomonella]